MEVAYYKYFLLGDTVPIRVSFNEKGWKFDAEIPDPENGGLIHRVTYLSRIEQSFEVDELTREQFEEHAAVFLATPSGPYAGGT